ncbi:RNA-directed DNA polymerase [Jatrophihabitans fulvus]
MRYGLNLRAAVGLFRAEMYGDWYRDPWGWPEVTALEREPDADDVLDELLVRDGNKRRPREQAEFKPLQVPKSMLGVRPAVVMSVDARLLYLAAAATTAPRLHANLPEWVFGWRMRQGPGLAPNDDEWDQYVGSLNDAVPPWDSVLATDVTSFFASVRVDELLDDTNRLIGDGTALHVFDDLVRAHDRMAAFGGLPQRSWASAVLANRYLWPLDQVVGRNVQTNGPIWRAARWMDDIYIVGRDSALYALNLELHDRARQLGLELNASKSHLMEAGDFDRHFRHVGMRDVPRGQLPPAGAASGPGRRRKAQIDPSWLSEMESEILAGASVGFDRPVVRLVLRGVRDQQLFTRWAEWRDMAHRMPQHADLIGRYLRDAASDNDASLSQGELGEWFSDFVKSSWPTLPWVAGQLALSLGSRQDSQQRFDALYRDWISESDDLQQVAVAIHRLGRTAPDAVREAVRDRLDQTTSPLLLRVFALGLLPSGEGAAFVRTVAARDPRNRLLLRTLERDGYRARKVPADFDEPGD